MSGKKIFAKLAVWDDPVPREGPAQMACDEALLSIVDLPVLRVFHWAQPWISAGFFIPHESARMVRPDLPFCRRWTGGGVVVHEGDFTFSLVVPRHESWALLRPRDTYRFLHEAMARALRQAGVAAELAQVDVGQEQCFIAPVRNDLLANGRKIAGGAQRRTKRGLLHQGSIQVADIRRDFSTLLASHLACESSPWQPPDELESNTQTLVCKKYTNEEFLARGVLVQDLIHPNIQP